MNLLKFIPLVMLTIVLLGNGNVAHHLYQAINSSATVRVVQVYGRNEQGLKDFEYNTLVTTSAETIVDADLYLIAVNDDAIPEVAAGIRQKKGLVAHTSGAVPITSLPNSRRAVFYPLQSFTRDIPVNFTTIPICLEAEHEKDFQVLEVLAKSLSRTVCRMDSQQRLQLHLAAIFANNFSNYLYYLAQEICKEQEINFELLHPLILETANKMRFLPPKKAQTGPARRQDAATMQKHLEMLKNPTHRNIYEVMSHSIQELYEKKL